MTFSILVLLLTALAAVLTVGFYAWTGVPALPTSPRVLGVMLALIDRAPRLRAVDLGSGYGTLVLETARRHPRTLVSGYEVSIVPFLISRVRLWAARLPNASIRYGDFFQVDLSGYDLLTCYLTRAPMLRLRDKLDAEMPAGAELICHTFALPGWEPLERIHASDLFNTPVYRYAKREPPRLPVRHPWMEPPPRAPSGPRKLLSD